MNTHADILMLQAAAATIFLIACNVDAAQITADSSITIRTSIGTPIESDSELNTSNVFTGDEISSAEASVTGGTATSSGGTHIFDTDDARRAFSFDVTSSIASPGTSDGKANHSSRLDISVRVSIENPALTDLLGTTGTMRHVYDVQAQTNVVYPLPGNSSSNATFGINDSGGSLSVKSQYPLAASGAGLGFEEGHAEFRGIHVSDPFAFSFGGDVVWAFNISAVSSSPFQGGTDYNTTVTGHARWLGVQVYDAEGNLLTDNDIRIYEVFNNNITGFPFVTDPAIPGDLDGDGFVGIDDLNMILADWNQTVPPADPWADVSGDGFIGIDDLNTVLANWNAGTPPIGTVNIPEPMTMLLMGLGAAVALARHHRL